MVPRAPADKAEMATSEMHDAKMPATTPAEVRKGEDKTTFEVENYPLGQETDQVTFS